MAFGLSGIVGYHVANLDLYWLLLATSMADLAALQSTTETVVSQVKALDKAISGKVAGSSQKALDVDDEDSDDIDVSEDEV